MRRYATSAAPPTLHLACHACAWHQCLPLRSLLCSRYALFCAPATLFFGTTLRFAAWWVHPWPFWLVEGVHPCTPYAAQLSVPMVRHYPLKTLAVSIWCLPPRTSQYCATPAVQALVCGTRYLFCCYATHPRMRNTTIVQHKYTMRSIRTAGQIHRSTVKDYTRALKVCLIALTI